MDEQGIIWGKSKNGKGTTLYGPSLSKILTHEFYIICIGILNSLKSNWVHRNHPEIYSEKKLLNQRMLLKYMLYSKITRTNLFPT